MNSKQQTELGKRFRQWLRESVEAEPGVSGAAKEKAAWRRDRAKDGWFNVSFTGPASAVEHAKASWAAYKKNNAHLWKGREAEPDTDESED